MTEHMPDARGALAEADIVHLDGHFIDRKGRHTRDYVDMEAFHRNPMAACEIGRCLAFPFRGNDWNVQTVLGCGEMGQTLAHWIAYHLQIFAGSLRRDRIVTAAYVTRHAHDLVIHPAWETSVKGKRVLMVMDFVAGPDNPIVHTLPTLREYGAEIIGAGTMATLSSVTSHDFGNIPFLQTLANVSGDRWAKHECPLCAKGIPIRQDVGYGSTYQPAMERKKALL